MDGINTAIEKAQELIRDEKTTVKVFVSGESLAEVVSGFEQTRKMISTAADKVEAIADYLDRQMEVLPKSMENKGEAMKKAFRLMTDSGIDPEQAYQLLDSPLGKLIQIQAYLDEIGSAEDFNNLPVEERNELIDLMGANIKLAGLEKVSGLTVELQNIREQAGLKLLQFYRDGFNSAADFLSENEDGVNASLSVLDILPGAMWALAGMGEGTLEVVNPVTNGEHRSNESMIEYYAEEFETGVKRVVNAKEGIDEKSEEFQAFLFETALKQLREADISGEDAALAGTIIGAATIAKLASKRLTAGGKGSEAKKLAKDIKALASEIDRKILEHDALKSFDLNLARIEVTTVRSGLTSKLKRSGNVATAKIKIDGIPEKMNAHSQIEPYNITEKMKDMGLVPGGSGNFTAKDIENAVGDKIPRHVDSEYKILDNIADQLGGNYTARGSVTIFTERPACGSCLSVADQFVQKYPNIVVVIKDNKGNLLNPNRKED
ncbi:deaminase domain-containing protein [Aestuariispira insulae]|uniref:deaminase domain-containing protein n=1 Tax=Aestuariispira insulae TaxID=1461337 RepID=UPI0011C02DA9|nr:deaminase domain-containing protein [Aestuariispira insulae]